MAQGRERSKHKDRKKKRKKRSKSSSLLPSYHFLLCVPLLTGSSYLLGNFMGKILAIDLSPCECREPPDSALRGIQGATQRGRDVKLKHKHGEDEMDMIDRLVKERVKAALEREKPSLPQPKFPPATSQFANGMVKVSQSEFKAKYIDGTPKDSTSGNSEAIVLYNVPESLPNGFQQESHELETYPLDQALQNCDTMNVVYQNPKVDSGQCFAILSDSESYRLQRWMKVDDDASPMHPKFRPVEMPTPDDDHQNLHRRILKAFLDTQEKMMLDLKEKLERIAIDNVVIVMTSNFGQSDLLTNFVCAANSKGFDISNVILFATDRDSASVSEGLELETFYSEENFGFVSSKEAMNYGDDAFTGMMYAKVLSVLLVNSLGYDVLFQDLDVVWYKHPLDFFGGEIKAYADRDIILQDDGSRSPRFSPSFANSGFYFVRNNARTRYLFVSMLYSMGLVLESGSHQKVLIALMNEHSSNYGLKVEILQGNDFPGGKEFHRDKALMKDILQKKIIPYAFHMSWTKNKVNKIKFFKQMGVWHVRESCEGSKRKHVSGLKKACCSLEPLVSCSYKDKPSIIPCKESPSIDKNGHSFW